VRIFFFLQGKSESLTCLIKKKKIDESPWTTRVSCESVTLGVRDASRAIHLSHRDSRENLFENLAVVMIQFLLESRVESLGLTFSVEDGSIEIDQERHIL